MAAFDEFMRTIQSRYNGGFQPYAAGNKHYGVSGRTAPNLGPTENRVGYAERDRMARLRRTVMLKKMKALQQNRLMDPEYLRNSAPGTFRM